jgi:hypothetical protein
MSTPGRRVARALQRGTERGLDVHNRKDGVLEQNGLAAAETAPRKQRLAELPRVAQLELASHFRWPFQVQITRWREGWRSHLGLLRWA